MSIPLSLYIHIPWCVKKCPYCDFNSHAIQNHIPQTEYVAALLQDLKQDLHHVQNREIQSIFFGGGTPSLLAPSNFAYLLDEVAKLLQFSKNIEITMEANPGTIEHYNFNDYLAAGINRISIGVQTFNDNHLVRLGRIHKAYDSLQAINKIQSLPLKSFNIDLMHTLPGQTVAEALADLRQAINASPHISWYQLTIEPNTVFYKYPPKLPDDEVAWEILQQGEKLLECYNYRNYEVSAYAKDAHQCRHNINYWEFGDYIGIGAGAHGKITIDATKKVIRTKKTRNPKDYLDKTQEFLADSNIISDNELPIEYMLNRLRLFQPLKLQDFEKRTGLPLSSIITKLEIASIRGLINYDAETLQVTEIGRRFLNDLTQVFLD